MVVHELGSYFVSIPTSQINNHQSTIINPLLSVRPFSAADQWPCFSVVSRVCMVRLTLRLRRRDDDLGLCVTCELCQQVKGLRERLVGESPQNDEYQRLLANA